MGQITISVPDELLYRARLAGLNISRLSAFAIIEELDRQAQIEALDAYVNEIDAGLGRTPPRSPTRPPAPWETEPLQNRPAPGPPGPPEGPPATP
jgi:hypothetical protein